MMDITINIAIAIFLGLFGGVLYAFLHDWYKDREWRRNNPDEHEIMNRKIKDDFTK